MKFFRSAPTKNYFWIGIFFAAFVAQSACATGRFYDVRQKKYVTREDLVEAVRNADDVVIGERHDTPSVQRMEAELLKEFAAARRAKVTFAWEFLNWSERTKISDVYQKFKLGKINAIEFLEEVFGKKNPPLTYRPLIEAAKEVGAEILATNLSRAEKKPVVDGGIGALDPTLLPPGFQMGGEAYFKRFELAMQGHADARTIRNYFEAQCLVDDVVAYHFVQDRSTPSGFLVIGDFHARYFDGVWKRILARDSGRRRLLVKISEPWDDSARREVLDHPEYGLIADYLVFTR